MRCDFCIFYGYIIKSRCHDFNRKRGIGFSTDGVDWLYGSRIKSGMTFVWVRDDVQGLVYKDVPVECVLDFAALDAADVVVELEGLWTALAVTVCVDGLFL